MYIYIYTYSFPFCLLIPALPFLMRPFLFVKMLFFVGFLPMAVGASQSAGWKVQSHSRDHFVGSQAPSAPSIGDWYPKKRRCLRCTNQQTICAVARMNVATNWINLDLSNKCKSSRMKLHSYITTTPLPWLVHKQFGRGCPGTPSPCRHCQQWLSLFSFVLS